MRVIHAPHPNGLPHPFKFLSLCGKMIRFGGIEIYDSRPLSCKKCSKVLESICPTCRGTGRKPDREALVEGSEK